MENSLGVENSTKNKTTKGDEENETKHKITIPYLFTPIFKLNLDCFENILALLSLSDLHAVSQTCKRLQQVTGTFFQQNYRTLDIWIEYNSFRYSYLQLDNFSSFIENICIDNSIENFQFAGNVRDSSMKKIYFSVVSINQSKIDCIKQILDNVEAIMLSECTIEDDLYEICLKFCPKLKRLSVVFYEGFQNQWLSQTYSSLEYLKLAGEVTFGFHDVKRFFENNPNCKSFWIDARYLMENRHSLSKSGLKWCDLTVSMATTYADNMNHYLVLFEELYACGIYQRLHLFLNGKEWNQQFFKQLASVPFLINLCLEYFEDFNIESLNKLIKLEIYMPLLIFSDKMENIAKNLVNLERIVFRDASINDILPFIRHSKRLKEIRVSVLKNGIYFNNGRLNLKKLNQERTSLNRARKVIMYVEENVFLSTRWSNVMIDFNLFEIRRLSAYKDFSFYPTYI